MTATPTPYSTISNAHDLGVVWQQLMGTGGFGQRTLWVIFLDPRRRLQRTVMPIDDVPATPEPSVLATLSQVLIRALGEQGLGSTAFLLSRPGARQMTAADRAWARALRSLDDERLRYWPVHLATHRDVRVFAPDDLIGVG